MNGSLWLLLFLNVRARYRRIARGLRTLKGLLLILFGLGFFIFIVTISLISRSMNEFPRDTGLGGNPIQRFGPAGILIFALLSIFASTKYRGVYFSPAEVDFLFQAPFTRRELLIYRISTQFIYTTISVFIMSFVLCQFFPGILQTMAGLFLTFSFLNLVQIAGSLLSGSLQERAVARGRKFILFLLILFALLTFGAFTAAFRGGEELRESVKTFIGSPAMGWALLPLKTFSETLTASDLKSFLLWGAGAAVVDLALLGLILRLDIDYMESSIETSRKIYQRIQQMRKGGRMIQPGKKLHLSIPMPSRWGGVGVVAWRQAQEMVRETPGAVYLLLALSLGAVLPVAFFSDGKALQVGNLARSFSGIVIVLPLILSNWFRFDFRCDLERMELLKCLPLSPGRLALGQILVPAFMLTVLQLVGYGLVLWALGTSRERIYFQCLILLSLPLNLLFVSMENFFFLIYPTRLAPTAPGDFQAMGRMMFTFFLKMVTLLAVISICGLLGLFIQFVTGSMLLGFLAGGGFLLLADWAAVLLVGWAFARFDVSRPAPE